MRRWAIITLALTACHPGFDLGFGERLRFADASYLAEPPPAPSGGPEVLSLESSRSIITPGDRDHPIRGTMPSTAESALLSVRGEPGHWIVVAGAPDAFSPELRVIDARAELDASAPAGELVVEARAVDAAGRVGAPRSLALEVQLEPEDQPPLLVTLAWSGEADLDLRVVDPAGNELSLRDPTTRVPGEPATGDEAELDLDAQAGCRGGGPRRERVRWPRDPAPGTYVVRVDAFAMCGAPSAHWRARVTRHGRVLGEAFGAMTARDTRFSHERGAGLTVLAVTIE